MEKWAESAFKVYCKSRSQAHLVSAREPEYYGIRFKNFMKDEVFIQTNRYDIEEEFDKLKQDFYNNF